MGEGGVVTQSRDDNVTHLLLHERVGGFGCPLEEPLLRKMLLGKLAMVCVSKCAKDFD